MRTTCWNGSIADDEHLGFLAGQSVLASPLTWDGTMHGVLAFFDHRDGGFSDESLNLVRVLSTQAARAVAAMPDTSSEPERSSHDADGCVDLSELF